MKDPLDELFLNEEQTKYWNMGKEQGKLISKRMWYNKIKKDFEKELKDLKKKIQSLKASLRFLKNKNKYLQDNDKKLRRIIFDDRVIYHEQIQEIKKFKSQGERA